MIKWIVITLLLVVIILFLIISKNKSNKSTRTTSHYNPIHKKTKNELISSLPKEKQLEYTHLFNSLDSLEDLIDSYSKDISKEQSNTERAIKNKIQEASNAIKARWEKQINIKGYRECLALHYASFTLADNIYEQKEKVKSMFVKLREMNHDLGCQIDDLSKRINSRSGNIKEIKNQHKSLCEKRSQISKIQHIYGANLKEYNNRLNYQNHITEQYRDYIGKNFGAQGKAWLNRLNLRKSAKR